MMMMMMMMADFAQTSDFDLFYLDLDSYFHTIRFLCNCTTSLFFVQTFDLLHAAIWMGLLPNKISLYFIYLSMASMVAQWLAVTS